jgi:S1-C subfamily serine protease
MFKRRSVTSCLLLGVFLLAICATNSAPMRKFEEVLGLNGAAAILVGGVDPGLPADNAGLRTGDVILSFNGQGMRAFTHYRSFLESMRQAAFHGGATLDIERYDSNLSKFVQRKVELHLVTEPADAGQIYLGIRATATFFILDVPAGSLAQRLGLSSGEFIEEVNGQDFASAGDLDRLAATIEGSTDRQISLWVTRWTAIENGKVGGNRTRIVQGTLGNQESSVRPFFKK